MKNVSINPLLKTALFLLVSSIISLSCSEDPIVGDNPPNPPSSFTWKQVGLDDLTVNRLELVGNQLYAMTNDGLYTMNVDTDNDFSLVGLKGLNLLDMVMLDENHWLASYRGIDWGGVEIYETLDGGLNWTVKEHNFGVPEHQLPEITEAVTDFKWDVANNILYATGYYVLAKSTDQGTTWEPIWGGWDYLGTGMMIEINPQKPNDIWFGGQGGFENGYLVNFQNGAVRKEWNDLVPNPTVPQEIVFDNSTPQNIYVGWEGELNKTSDAGESWTMLIDRHEESHFFFGVGVSSINPDLIFAGKWIKGVDEQPLTLYYSRDGGDTWQEDTYTDEDFGGIFDLKIISTADQERIFLALDKGGVYEVTTELNKPQTIQ
ncbi:MAG: hypothetical protein AAF944_14680 [Bacteroidota bacterium]